MISHNTWSWFHLIITIIIKKRLFSEWSITLMSGNLFNWYQKCWSNKTNLMMGNDIFRLFNGQLNQFCFGVSNAKYEMVLKHYHYHFSSTFNGVSVQLTSIQFTFRPEGINSQFRCKNVLSLFWKRPERFIFFVIAVQWWSGEKCTYIIHFSINFGNFF